MKPATSITPRDPAAVQSARFRASGLVIAALGLIIGACALNQSIHAFQNPRDSDTPFEWIVVEGISCAGLSAVGFVLLVLGSDHGDEVEERKLEVPPAPQDSWS